MRITRRAGRALAVALLGALGACTNSPPTPVPTAGTPLSPMPSSSPSPSTSSAAPTTSDEELAIDAVRAYYAAFNQAIATRSTNAFRAAFTAGCRICKEDAAKIDDALRAGRTFEGGASTPTQLTVTSRPDPQRVMVRALVVTEAMKIRDASGKVLTDQPADRGMVDYIVKLDGAEWRVEGLAS